MDDNSLTLFIFPGDKAILDDLKRCVESLSGCDVEIVVLNSRDELADEPLPQTQWWGFLFCNEWLDIDLQSVLNVYLQHCKDDVLVFYKRTFKGKDYVHELAPRIFRTKSVPMLGVETYKEAKNLSTLRVLDGWIREVDRIG